ncbi:MAG: hypothetical protein ACIAQZ_03670 [Sedimentisphaeraceae bacterium JB056]
MRTQTLLATLLITAAICFAEPRFNWDEVSGPHQRERGFAPTCSRQFGRECQQPQQRGFQARPQFRGWQQFRGYGPQATQGQRQFSQPNFQGHQGMRRGQWFQGHTKGFGYGNLPQRRDAFTPRWQHQGQFEGRGFGQDRRPYAQGRHMGSPYGGKGQFQQRGFGQGFESRKFAYPDSNRFDFDKSNRFRDQKPRFECDGKEGKCYRERGEETRGFGKEQYERKPQFREGREGQCTEEGPKAYKHHQGKGFCQEKEGACDIAKDKRQQMHHRQSREGGEKPEGQGSELRELKLKLRDAVMDKDYQRAERILNRLKDIDK